MVERMYIVNTSYVWLLVHSLQAEGIDTKRLCQEIDLEIGLLGDEEAFVERRKVYELMERAAEVSGNPNIGLTTYAHFTPGSFQLLSYVMMSSPNLKTALQRLIRFAPLLGNGYHCTLEAEADGRWRLSVMEYREADITRPRQMSDAGCAAMLGMYHWLTGGRSLRPVAIELSYPEPNDVSAHRRLFDCPLRFGTAFDSTLFDEETLLAPLSTANETLSLLHERFAQARLTRLFGDSMVDRVRALLIERLPQGGGDIETVSSLLCMSKRTLQRSLEKEGTQFKDVVNDIRHQLADYYLCHSRLTLLQISESLGFQDLSAFHKACQRWFGLSPGRYREEQWLRNGQPTKAYMRY